MLESHQQPEIFMESITSSSTHTRIIALLLALLVIAVGAGVYFYQKAAETPREQATSELDTIVARVGRLMVLPEGEMPTLATVSDPEKLKSQPFFAHAQKGDAVLIYAIARKAILYNPTLNKIVEIAPVNAGGAAPEPTNAPLQENQ